MKVLNFFPFYEPLLRSRQKTTTIRLNDPGLTVGDQAYLTLGWDETRGNKMHRVLVTEVYKKKIADLDEHDFLGESPDCKSREATRLVLSSIYRTLVNEEDEVWVVKFSHEA